MLPLCRELSNIRQRILARDVVFLAESEGVIRTILYYPMSCGRNFDEIKRIIQSLQTHDEHHVSTPADWRPGDPVVMPAPLTLEAAEERMVAAEGNDDVEIYDWYLGFKKLD